MVSRPILEPVTRILMSPVSVCCDDFKDKYVIGYLF